MEKIQETHGGLTLEKLPTGKKRVQPSKKIGLI